MKKPVLSIAIITLNEERNIGRCLRSLAPLRKRLVLEVLVVDAMSSDRTAPVARELGARVFRRPWKGYSDQKNWALNRCRGEWLLSLDADEELIPALCGEIAKAALEPRPGIAGYWIKRRAIFLGKWIRHCGWWPDAQLRLFRKGKGRFTSHPVHEGLEVEGKTVRFREPMNHFTYFTIRQYVGKMNRYSDLALEGLERRSKKVRWWKFYLLVIPVQNFLKMYIKSRGFLDGWHGFVVCALSSFHDFVKYAKLWEKEILKIK
jgi:glycosyltransferase involved in cell wall biosynthesis